MERDAGVDEGAEGFGVVQDGDAALTQRFGIGHHPAHHAVGRMIAEREGAADEAMIPPPARGTLAGARFEIVNSIVVQAARVDWWLLPRRSRERRGIRVHRSGRRMGRVHRSCGGR